MKRAPDDPAARAKGAWHRYWRFLLGLDVFMSLPNPTLLWLLPVFVNWNWIAQRLPFPTLDETGMGEESSEHRGTAVQQAAGVRQA